MELWVRSQDKKLLRKPEQLGIYEGNEVWFIGENLLMDYGKYKTKERALEVLDEIQNKLLKSKYDKASEDYGKHSDCKDTLIEISSSTYVYEMPQE